MNLYVLVAYLRRRNMLFASGQQRIGWVVDNPFTSYVCDDFHLHFYRTYISTVQTVNWCLASVSTYVVPKQSVRCLDVRNWMTMESVNASCPI